MNQQSTPNDPPQPADRKQARICRAIILSAALSTAFVDETLNRLIGGAAIGGQHWTQNLACLAATFMASATIIFIAITAIALVLRRTNAIAVACGVSLTAWVTIIGIALILPGEDLFPSDASTGLPIAAIMLVACWIGYRAYPAIQQSANRCGESQWMALLTLTPLSLGVALLLAIQYIEASLINIESIALTTIAGGGLIVGWRTFAGKNRFTRIRTGKAIATATVMLILCGLTAWFEPKLTTAALTRAPDRDHSTHPRRVLLLTVDTLRADKLGYLGGDVATPNIDALAHKSSVFENAMSPAAWTLPAFASIMTGLYPNVHQATRHTSRLPFGATTLAQRLREAGLQTAAIGDNPFLLAESGMNQGFDEYHMFGGPDGKASFGKRLLHRVAPHRFVAAPTSGDLTDMACHWLEHHAAGAFFLWLHYFDPHLPYAPPARFASDAEPPPGLGRTFNDIDGARGGYIATTAPQRAWIEQLYDAEVRYVDDCVGRVLNKLESLGIDDDTLIVFASDHGEEFWEHGGFEHGHSLYNEVIHVPLIVKSAKSARAQTTAPARIQQPVTTTAIAPTILAALSIEADADAFSVGPLELASARDNENRVASPIYSTGLLYFENRESILSGSFKYIRSAVTGAEQLFDLDADPKEAASLTMQQPSLIESARQSLSAIHKSARQLCETLNIRATDADISAARRRQLESLGYVR